MVVHGSANPLLAAKIAFSCLHGNVPEKESDLIQFSTRCVAQLRARTSQIMRCLPGPRFVIMSDLVGRSEDDAINEVVNAGLHVPTINTQAAPEPQLGET